MSRESRAEDYAYIQGADLCGQARVSGHGMVLELPATHKAPFLSERCVVCGIVSGDIHIMGQAVILEEERVSNSTPDTLVINGQERRVIRDPSRDELAPRQQEKQKKPKNKGRER